MQELYPIGEQSFRNIRQTGKVYVDKTGLIYKLVHQSKYIFLARPRRFGKSLLLSTIKAYFEGEKQLFEGLKIYELENKWEKYPVFLLQLTSSNINHSESLSTIIDQHFKEWENLYQIENRYDDYSARFRSIIKEAYRKKGKKVVVLIDEYDNPLINTLEEYDIHKNNINLLKSIYSNLKDLDEYIQFAMLTGVTRFSQMSIFSGLNNLNDITLDPQYSTICGITQQELEHNFQRGIENLALGYQTDVENVLSLLKENYDGYHFSEDLIDVYNPFSLLCAFEKKKIGTYWFATGTPTFLIKALYEKKVELSNYFNQEAPANLLSSNDTGKNSPLALLFQTGYLTIKNYDKEWDLYALGIPNKEVETGLLKEMTLVFQDKESAESLTLIKKLIISLRAGEAENFVLNLKKYFAGIPYNITQGVSELFFENNIYIIVKLIGLHTQTEYTTSDGRIDLVITAGEYLYIIELKLDGSAKEALHQIESKEYAGQFYDENKKIIKIGINFSSKTRNISDWIIKEPS